MTMNISATSRSRYGFMAARCMGSTGRLRNEWTQTAQRSSVNAYAVHSRLH